MDKSKVLKDIKLFVLDLDGTFYLGNRILPNSLKFIRRVRETNRRFLFFTNNSSTTSARYVDKISHMGLLVRREDVVTSGDVTIEYLKKNHAGASVYLMGTEALRGDFAAAGLRLTPDETGGGGEYGAVGAAKQIHDNAVDGKVIERADVVVAAFDTELNYAKLARACDYVRGGAVFLATHEDVNCPTDGGFIPDCGAFCAAITLSTGRRPKYLGKPHAETVEMVLALTGAAREELAFVGDRLYTDVAAGVNNGVRGLLVLSGETKAEDIAASPVKPDAVFADLGELAEYL